MIFVDRSQVPTPSELDLDDPESKGSKEKNQAINRLGTANPMKSDEFKAYAHKNVRKALTVLFNGKCAYCESQISGSSQTDIEHYRPKGKVKEKPDHPGYWWLAMDWFNLVLSCMHCNQSRRQEINDPDWTVEEIEAAYNRGRLSTVGKKNAFPTLDDTWVDDHNDDINAKEKPALIDPTVTDPKGMFDWIYSTDLIVTMKGIDPEGRGQITIDQLGFNRRYLTEARMATQSILNNFAEDLRIDFEEFRQATSEEAQELALRNLIRTLKSLRKLSNPQLPFSGMAYNFYKKQKDLYTAALA